MIGGRSMRPVYLDSTYVFSVWVMTGSLVKLARRMTADGFINPETGKSFTISGLFSAAKRSRAYMEFSIRREPGINGEPPEIPVPFATKEEMAWATQYYNEHYKQELEKSQASVREYEQYRKQS